MGSKRQLQVGELIKRHFGHVLMQEGSYIYGNEALVTITNVTCSPDLSLAKIYVSVYNVEDKGSIVKLMEHSNHTLKQALSQRLKKHIRRIPRIEFYIDDTLDEMYKLNQMFDNLK